MRRPATRQAVNEVLDADARTAGPRHIYGAHQQRLAAIITVHRRPYDSWGEVATVSVCKLRHAERNPQSRHAMAGGQPCQRCQANTALPTKLVHRPHTTLTGTFTCVLTIPPRLPRWLSPCAHPACPRSAALLAAARQLWSGLKAERSILTFARLRYVCMRAPLVATSGPQLLACAA